MVAQYNIFYQLKTSLTYHVDYCCKFLRFSYLWDIRYETKLKLTDSNDDDHIFNLLNNADIKCIFEHLFRANCDDRQNGKGVDTLG